MVVVPNAVVVDLLLAVVVFVLNTVVVAKLVAVSLLLAVVVFVLNVVVVPNAVVDRIGDSERCAASVVDDVVVNIDFDVFYVFHCYLVVVVEYCFVAAD